MSAKLNLDMQDRTVPTHTFKYGCVSLNEQGYGKDLRWFRTKKAAEQFGENCVTGGFGVVRLYRTQTGQGVR